MENRKVWSWFRQVHLYRTHSITFSTDINYNKEKSKLFYEEALNYNRLASNILYKLLNNK